MRKLLAALSISSILLTTPLSVVACSNNNEVNLVKTPDWVDKMVKLVEEQQKNITIGYDNYFLINKTTKDKKDYDPFQQKDWININQNQNLYLYLPQANTIDEAIKQVEIDDSAKTTPIGIETPVTWKKINETTYTNNNFITQDTTVAGIALMDQFKHNQIRSSNKWGSFNQKEKENFLKFGSLFPNSNKSWWNINGWEKLLSTKQELTSNKGEKVSQLDLYQKWTKQKLIGMNVPLSLMAEDTFKLQATKIKHVFLFSATPKQVWIDTNGNLTTINTPHWGFTMNIVDQNKNIIFKTPQLLNLKNAFKADLLHKSLKQWKFFSFNEQETTKFKNHRIN